MRDHRGFTLIEILVSMAIFSVIAVGALGVIGAADTGGFLEGFPSAFVTARVARDYTAASVSLQAFQEYVQSMGSANATPGTFCKGTGCTPEVELPVGLAGYPLPALGITTPTTVPYQLQWTRLDVAIERWYVCFNMATTPPTFVKYSPDPGVGCTVDTTMEYLVRVRATLTWVLRTKERTLTMDRFIGGVSP